MPARETSESSLACLRRLVRPVGCKQSGNRGLASRSSRCGCQGPGSTPRRRVSRLGFPPPRAGWRDRCGVRASGRTRSLWRGLVGACREHPLRCPQLVHPLPRRKVDEEAALTAAVIGRGASHNAGTGHGPRCRATSCGHPVLIRSCQQLPPPFGRARTPHALARRGRRRSTPHADGTSGAASEDFSTSGG
jgi:hypothetical protein